jgi:capsular polysaccharide export protein
MNNPVSKFQAALLNQSAAHLDAPDFEMLHQQARPLTFGDLPRFKKILLLQGPVGNFFYRLAHYFRSQGTLVSKINFNGGDDHFYPNDQGDVHQYRFKTDYFPTYIKGILEAENFDAVFLFGDSRKVHKPIISILKQHNIAVFAFEEGYFRPNFFTLERNGVNFNSTLSKISIREIEALDPIKINFEQLNFKSNRATRMMAISAIQYWFYSLINTEKYPDYDHHRSLRLDAAMNWIRGAYYFLLHKVTEKKKRAEILNLICSKPNHVFIAPLQLSDDPQVTLHSNFTNLEEYIELVLTSFAKHIKLGNINYLVIKNHPMGIGHQNYKLFISDLAKLLEIEEYIYYINNIVITHVKRNLAGCITLNSTYGLKCLSFGVPVITLGNCFYNKPELTFQGTLDQFWSSTKKIDPQIIERFNAFVISQTQINGSLYDPKYVIR